MDEPRSRPERLRDGAEAPSRSIADLLATPTGLPRQPEPPIVRCYLRTTRLNLVDAVCLVGLDESLTVIVTE